jgi:hypothetical protein
MLARDILPSRRMMASQRTAKMALLSQQKVALSIEAGTLILLELYRSPTMPGTILDSLSYTTIQFEYDKNDGGMDRPVY